MDAPWTATDYAEQTWVSPPDALSVVADSGTGTSGADDVWLFGIELLLVCLLLLAGVAWFIIKRIFLTGKNISEGRAHSHCILPELLQGSTFNSCAEALRRQLDRYVEERGCSDDFQSTVSLCAEEMLWGRGEASVIVLDQVNTDNVERLLRKDGHLLARVRALGCNVNTDPEAFRTLSDFHARRREKCSAALEREAQDGFWVIRRDGEVASAGADLSALGVPAALSGLDGCEKGRTLMGACEYLRRKAIKAAIFSRTDDGCVFSVLVPPRAALLGGRHQPVQAPWVFCSEPLAEV